MSLLITTSVYRLGDGLLLCQAHDGGSRRDAEANANEAGVFQHIRRQHLQNALPRHVVIDGNESSYFVLNDGVVAYVGCSPRGSYKEAVHSCLEDIRRAFNEAYSVRDVNAAVQPYSLINFDTTITRIVRKCDSQGGNAQVLALKKELQEVTGIMQQSLQDVLGRGEKLSDLQESSAKLRHESAELKKKSGKLSRSFYLQYAAPVAVGATVVMLVWWKLGFGMLFLF